MSEQTRLQKAADNLIEAMHHAATSNIDPTDYARIAERHRYLITDALAKEMERCIQAVRDEPECPDAPTGQIYEQFLRDVATIVQADLAFGTHKFVEAVLRLTVRETKKGIENRINRNGNERSPNAEAKTQER